VKSPTPNISVSETDAFPVDISPSMTQITFVSMTVRIIIFRVPSYFDSRSVKMYSTQRRIILRATTQASLRQWLLAHIVWSLSSAPGSPLPHCAWIFNVGIWVNGEGKEVAGEQSYIYSSIPKYSRSGLVGPRTNSDPPGSVVDARK
jgi:hypothetical protein